MLTDFRLWKKQTTILRVQEPEDALTKKSVKERNPTIKNHLIDGGGCEHPTTNKLTVYGCSSFHNPDGTPALILNHF